MVFKNSLAKLTKSLSETTSNVVQKSNDLIEISRLNIEIDNEENEKNIIYMEIGKLVYNSYVTNTMLSEEIKSKCQTIAEHDQQIKKIKGQILAIRKIKNCSNCGVEMNIEINFCPNCGVKQELIINNKTEQTSYSVEEDDVL